MDLLKVHLHCERSTVSFHLIEYLFYSGCRQYGHLKDAEPALHSS